MSVHPPPDAHSLPDRLSAATLDAIDQLVWLTSPDGHAFWFNARWTDFSGLPLDRLMRSGWIELQHPEHRDRVAARVRDAGRDGVAWTDSIPLREAGGSYRWFRITQAPVRDAGRIVHWIGTAADISAQRQAEQSLHELGDRTGKMIATLGHELRNPLSPIQLAAQILQAPGVSDSKRAEAANLIVRQTRHMNRLIENLLSVERFRQGTITLNTARCNLSELVSDTVEAYRISVAEHRLTIETSIQPDLFVLADETRLVQVVGNLLHNACKYTPAGGWIRVTVARADSSPSTARITVADNGVGVEPQLLPGIFGEFVQFHSELSPSRSGLGLGLAMVRRLAELHGGKAWAHSDGPGQGTTFGVELPLFDGACGPTPD